MARRRLFELLRSVGPGIAGVSTGAITLSALILSSSHAHSDLALIPHSPRGMVAAVQKVNLKDTSVIARKPSVEPSPDFSALLLTSPSPSSSSENSASVGSARDSPSSLTLPALPEYSGEFYSALQVKLFAEGAEIVSAFDSSSSLPVLVSALITSGWSLASEGEDLYVLKRAFECGGREGMRYCVVGESAVEAQRLHAVLADAENRKHWDKSAVEICGEHGNFFSSPVTVFWSVAWPWPLADRFYRFRQSVGASNSNLLTVVCAGLSAPVDKKSSGVFVNDYVSVAAIRAKQDKRSEFCMFYHEDPQLGTAIPAWLENFFSKSLLPDFFNNLIQGANRYDRMSEYQHQMKPKELTTFFTDSETPHIWETRHVKHQRR